MNRPAALTAACSMVGMPVPLPFTEADIKLAAGARSFERGLDYLGAVGDLEISDTHVTASVYGTSEYSVRLVFGDQGLVRAEQKRKRNLMKILDQNGL